MSSPVEPVVTDELLEDLTAGLDNDVAGAEPTAEVPSPEAQPQPPETATPPEQQPETPGSVPPAKAAGPAAIPEPPTPQPFVPPTGEPFTLRVDRAAIPIEGAVQTPDGGVHFGPDAWRKVYGSFIGNRQEWHARETGYKAQLQQMQGRKSESESRATAFNAEMAALMDKGPEAMAAWLDDFERNRPILEANMKARQLQEQLDAREQVESSQAREAEAAALAGQLEAHFDHVIDVFARRPEFAAFVKSPDFIELKQTLREDVYESLFYEGDGGERDIKFNLERFERLWNREAAKHQKVAQTTTTITQAAKRNAAATAPVKPVAKPAERPRKPNGQFTEEPFDKDEFLRKTTFF